MQNTEFYKNVDSQLPMKEPVTREEQEQVYDGVVLGDNEETINAIPVLEYEEKLVSLHYSTSYTYLSLCCYGESTEVVRIKSKDLFKADTYISQFGYKPFAEFDETAWAIFFRIITKSLAQIEQRVVYCYSGWTKDLGKYLYGNLMVDANSVISVKSSFVKTDTLLSQKSSTEICQNINNLAMNVFSNEMAGFICILYLMQSHSKQRFVKMFHMAPEFVLFGVGRSGLYKTATIHATFNTHNGSTSSFEDTEASIRRLFQSNKSGITIVDDYKISNTKNNKIFEKIVRLSGDVKTTGKYVAGNEVVDELITGMSVITGEKRPQLQQSSYSRILFVDFERFPVDVKFLTELQNSQDDINSFVILFVQYILCNDNFEKEVKNLVEEYRDSFMKNPDYQGMHGRYYNIYGWFAAMWDVYVSLMQQYGVTVEFDFKFQMRDYIAAQHNMYDDDAIKMFRTAYLELFDANEFVVVRDKVVEDVNVEVLLLDDMIFLRSGTVYKKIFKFWQDKGIEFPVTEIKLRKLLYDSDILQERNGKFTTERKTRDNRSYSGYYLLKNNFMMYGGNKNEEF